MITKWANWRQPGGKHGRRPDLADPPLLARLNEPRLHGLSAVDTLKSGEADRVDQHRTRDFDAGASSIPLRRFSRLAGDVFGDVGAPAAPMNPRRLLDSHERMGALDARREHVADCAQKPQDNVFGVDVVAHGR